MSCCATPIWRCTGRKRAAAAASASSIPRWDAAARKAIQLEGELRRALARREFELVWQPQVSLRTGRICGAEALLRWRHAARGIVSPAEFLQLAEETGLIAPITEWALAAACAQGLAWARRRAEGLRISVNSLPRCSPPATCATWCWTRSPPPASTLALLRSRDHLSAPSLLDKVDETAATPHSLRGDRVSSSIDDFGTGYSSLAHARCFRCSG